MGDILPLFFSFASIAVILFFCYRLSRYLSGKTNGISSTRNIKILERAALSQNNGLAISEICGKYYLIGFSDNAVQLLQTIEKDDLLLFQQAQKMPFINAFHTALKSVKQSAKGNVPKDRNGQSGDEE